MEAEVAADRPCTWHSGRTRPVSGLDRLVEEVEHGLPRSAVRWFVILDTRHSEGAGIGVAEAVGGTSVEVNLSGDTTGAHLLLTILLHFPIPANKPP